MKNTEDTKNVSEILSALADHELNHDDQLTEEELINIVCTDREVMASWQCTHLVRAVMQEHYQSALSPDFAARISRSIESEAVLSAEFDDAAYQAAEDYAHEDYATEDYAREDYASEAPAAASVASLDEARAKSSQRRTNNTHQSQAQQPARFWQPLVGVGIAASVAGAVFMGSQLWQSQQPDAGSAATVAQLQEANTGSTTGLLQVAANVSQAGTHWRTDGQDSRNRAMEERLNMLLANHLEDASMAPLQGLVAYSRVAGYDSLPLQK